MIKKIHILHIGIHGNVIKNAGDKVHFYLLRKWFDEKLGLNIKWMLQQIWKKVNYKDILNINKKYDLILIGGGGLFLNDQKGAKNTPSNWQFNISNTNLKKINIPIIVFGVGFNKFRGQKNFNSKFKKSISILKKKSIFFGLRNKGSIEAIKKIILTGNISYQPCVTSFIDKIKYCKKIRVKKLKEISFGFASDRLNYRFGSEKKIRYFINSIISSIKYFSKYRINYLMHKPEDNYFLKFFDKTSLKKLRIVNLTNASIIRIIKFYKSQKIIFGMRGHNQLIAYGCQIPFYSFVTHNKIKYFCEDNGLIKFSSDIKKNNFKKKFINFCKNFSREKIILENKIRQMYNKQFIHSDKNMKFIKLKLKKIDFKS